MRLMQIRWSFLAVASCLGMMTGCGDPVKKFPPRNPDTVPFSGIIKRDGTPLPKALVRFLSAADKGADASGITNDDGKYELKILVDQKDKAGAPPGDYKVVVSRFVTPGGEAYDPSKPTEVPGMESLPPRFSDPNMSTLKATVPAGGGTADFDLKGK